MKNNLRDSQKIKLHLFFTRGVSLKNWLDDGIFFREKLLYEKYLEKNFFDEVNWYTYGTEDKNLEKKLKKNKLLDNNINIYQMPKFFSFPIIGNYLYSFFLPLIYKKKYSTNSILKTNQMDGSWTGLIAKILYNLPLINRCGYNLLFIEEKKKKFFFIRLVNYILVFFVFKFANINIFSNKNDRENLEKKFNLIKKKNFVINNFVYLKKINKRRRQKNDFVYIGRFSEEKNLFFTLMLIKKLDKKIDLYGHGPLMKKLRDYVKINQIKAQIFGKFNNNDVGKILSNYKYYIQLSKYESMPKTAIEAMYYGKVCFFSNVSGFTEISKKDFEAYFVNHKNINSAFKEISKKIKLNHKQISLNASKRIKQYFLLDKIINKEYSIIKKFIQKAH
jgi:glycosyltransferase involved in cell wall biosynthesis